MVASMSQLFFGMRMPVLLNHFSSSKSIYTGPVWVAKCFELLQKQVPDTRAAL